MNRMLPLAALAALGLLAGCAPLANKVAPVPPVKNVAHDPIRDIHTSSAWTALADDLANRVYPFLLDGDAVSGESVSVSGDRTGTFHDFMKLALDERLSAKGFHTVRKQGTYLISFEIVRVSHTPIKIKEMPTMLDRLTNVVALGSLLYRASVVPVTAAAQHIATGGATVFALEKYFRPDDSFDRVTFNEIVINTKVLKDGFTLTSFNDVYYVGAKDSALYASRELATLPATDLPVVTPPPPPEKIPAVEEEKPKAKRKAKPAKTKVE